jgi:hypothetical protein
LLFDGPGHIAGKSCCLADQNSIPGDAVFGVDGQGEQHPNQCNQPETRHSANLVHNCLPYRHSLNTGPSTTGADSTPRKSRAIFTIGIMPADADVPL